MSPQWVVVLTETGEYYNQEDVSRVVGPFQTESGAKAYLDSLGRHVCDARAYVLPIEAPEETA